MLLEIEQKTLGAGIRLVILKGRLTLGEETVRAEEFLCGLVSGADCKIVLDVSALNYVDSAGLGALAKFMATMKRAGGKLRLAGTTPRVVELLDFTRLSRVFPMFPDVKSACADI